MDLRCLVFSSDQGAAEPICQVLAELGAEAEHCKENVSAVQRVASEPFQIVIADWDEQPDAEFLLKAVRARKAGERPLTLAIVSDDASVPKALQAGANSILRKPILVNQVKDTLQTARSLLKARQESTHSIAAGAASAMASAQAIPAAIPGIPPEEAHLRAGEFLQTTAPAPATQIDTESEMQKSMEELAAGQVDPLRDLEPMAAAVAQAPQLSAPPAPARDEEPRGLEWYLKRRAGGASSAAQSAATAAAPAPAPAPVPEKPELLSFDQIPTAPVGESTATDSAPQAVPESEKKTEARLFAYIEGEGKEREESSQGSSLLGKKPIVAALILAACAIVAAPQSPWHAQERTLWARGQQALHAWLNPQLVTPVQAPVSHEDFARPGDEYKLPAAEPIPDATTDPSQIKVTPMVDPTAKKPNNTTGDQGATGETAVSPDQTQPPQQAPQIQVQENPPAANAITSASAVPATRTVPSTVSPNVTAPQIGSVPPTVASPSPVPMQPRPKPSAAVAPANSNVSIPTSLKSQMASSAPDMSGNKAPDTALPSIEPVEVPEATARGLLTTQPAIAYPATAKGQQGTVVLQVLIARDGSVQDAMFLQGSLAFARAAIDGVKQWAFKPYIMNGRPVSVQTKLTLRFQGGQ